MPLNTKREYKDNCDRNQKNEHKTNTPCGRFRKYEQESITTITK